MLYKRGKKWWVRFSVRGREIRVTSGTDRKALAEKFERHLREQVWKESELGEIQHTWDEAKERWLLEKAHKRSLQRDRDAFAACAKKLDGQFLMDIDDGYIDELTKELSIGRSAGGVNRILACIRSVIQRAAKKWKWSTAAPNIEFMPVERAAPRWENPERLGKLFAQLPPHARAIANFAVAAGPRSGNIFGLRWDRVDLDSACYMVEARDFKGKRTVGFPLSQEAIDILRAQIGKHAVYVFPDHKGRAPIKSIKTTWLKACKRAGLDRFRVHDLRHTWAAWHKLKGTPDRAIKELGGWTDARMVDRYGHINPLEYAQYVDNRRTINGTRKKTKKRKGYENSGI